MLLIVYDIHVDKLRTKFSKFLSRFGRRVQYSVFEIKNSPRIVDNIRTEIKTKFEKQFTQGDSVLVFSIPDTADILRFGYPVNEETDFLLFE
ncbi:MAG: CRISPR-associated endonuclease Cas2 [Lentisphaeria bacterium]|nr:CRISPR-associated endonuclease Cas2 [Lentisphaeria bacterium]